MSDRTLSLWARFFLVGLILQVIMRFIAYEMFKSNYDKVLYEAFESCPEANEPLTSKYHFNLYCNPQSMDTIQVAQGINTALHYIHDQGMTSGSTRVLPWEIEPALAHTVDVRSWYLDVRRAAMLVGQSSSSINEAYALLHDEGGFGEGYRSPGGVSIYPFNDVSFMWFWICFIGWLVAGIVQFNRLGEKEDREIRKYLENEQKAAKGRARSYG